MDEHLIYGKHPVLEALKEGRPFEKLLIQRPATSDELRSIVSMATKQNVLVQFVPLQKLNSVTRKNHQGVVGFVSLIPYYDVADILAKVYEEGRTPLFLVLDQITDVRNFGAIARTAECCGVDALVVPAKGSALISADAMKASAGALNRLPVCKVRFLAEALDFFKLNGLAVFASDLKAGKMLYDCDLTIPMAVILGSEEDGVSPKLLEMADQNFIIPMAGNFDSLNVSVSAGIIMYETLRQRKTSSL
jgi:23S rRNA (guanosine2251-2'-O)-methyltransferase